MEASRGTGSRLGGESAAFIRFDEERNPEAAGSKYRRFHVLRLRKSLSRREPSGLAGSGFSAVSSLAQAFRAAFRFAQRARCAAAIFFREAADIVLRFVLDF